MNPVSVNRLVEPIDRAIERLRKTDWFPTVQAWRTSPEGQALVAFIDRRLAAGATIFPSNVFCALELTPLAAVRVIIVGQDPYHAEGQAEGLAFSVPSGVKVPPSLRNLFAEIQRDLGLPARREGHLGDWARHGVLLLNTSLTVEEGRAGSHAKQGWEALTDRLIAVCARNGRPKVFMLWGAHAQARAPLISDPLHRHLLLQSNHPSPLSALRGPAPFIGNGHFGLAIEFMRSRGDEENPFLMP